MSQEVIVHEEADRRENAKMQGIHTRHRKGKAIASDNAFEIDGSCFVSIKTTDDYGQYMPGNVVS